VTTLAVEPLSHAAFAPFGRVVERPAGEPHAAGSGWRWWAEVASLVGDGRPWGVGYLALEPAALRFDWAERHMQSLEAIFATDGDLLLYVGPDEHREEPGRLAALDDFRVFLLPPGSGAVLNAGVWHGAPLAVDRPTSALVLLLEGTGRHDVTVARFADDPVTIEGGADVKPSSDSHFPG
jgi:ureidoglycolate lyase